MLCRAFMFGKHNDRKTFFEPKGRTEGEVVKAFYKTLGRPRTPIYVMIKLKLLKFKTCW